MLFGAKEAPATMRKEGIQRRGERRGGGLWAVAGTLAMALVLSGCSSVPDAINPVKWYENTVEFFSGEDDAEETRGQASREAVPGADQPFPNLATVPDRPEVSSAEERRQVAQGLVADSERRRYAQEVARQGAPTQMLGSEAPAAAPPALPAVPAPVEVSRAAPQPPVASARTPPASAAPPSAPAVRSPSALPPPPQVRTAPAPAPDTEVAQRPSPPPLSRGGSRPPFAGEAFETVVVSSSGVDTQASAATPTPRSGRMLPSSRVERAPNAASAAGGSLQVATIQYAHGSASLDSRDRAILRNVVALQRERGGVIRVVGHASARTANMDPVRHKMVNYAVSAERAEVVARTLTDLGVRPQDMVIVAKADTEPIYYEVMPSGEAGNRRTEVFLDF